MDEKEQMKSNVVEVGSTDSHSISHSNSGKDEISLILEEDPETLAENLKLNKK
ncbi:hypothetical protein C6P40_003918, partial [Pichia californica]